MTHPCVCCVYAQELADPILFATHVQEEIAHASILKVCALSMRDSPYLQTPKPAPKPAPLVEVTQPLDREPPGGDDKPLAIDNKGTSNSPTTASPAEREAVIPDDPPQVQTVVRPAGPASAVVLDMLRKDEKSYDA